MFPALRLCICAGRLWPSRKVGSPSSGDLGPSIITTFLRPPRAGFVIIRRWTSTCTSQILFDGISAERVRTSAFRFSPLMPQAHPLARLSQLCSIRGRVRRQLLIKAMPPLCAIFDVVMIENRFAQPTSLGWARNRTFVLINLTIVTRPLASH